MRRKLEGEKIEKNSAGQKFSACRFWTDGGEGGITDWAGLLYKGMTSRRSKNTHMC